MIIDVDGLTRCFDKLSTQYDYITSLLSYVDHKARTSTYIGSINSCSSTSNIKPDKNGESSLVPILTTSTITGYKDHPITTPVLDSNPTSIIISSVHIMLHSALPMSHLNSTSIVTPDGVSPRITKLALDTIVNWLCIDNVCG